MNEARPLSDYLRPPYRLGEGLTPVEEAGSRHAWLGARVDDEITRTVASVLQEGTAALRIALPQAMCHIVYLRGSPVFDRITLVAPVWEQALDLLDLRPVVAQLRQEQSEERVDFVLDGARRKMAEDLLGLGSKSGIAKPLYRLRPPDEALYRESNRPAVRALIESLPGLLDPADEDVRDVVRSTPVLKMRPGLEAHFNHVMNGLGGDEMIGSILSRLATALPTLLPELNPLLPLTTEAVLRVKSVFDLADGGAAGEVLALLRFAALTMPLLRPKTTSDLAFRFFSVVPAGYDLATAQEQVLAVAMSTDAQETLARLREANPQLEVSLRPYVLQAPPVQASAAAWLDKAARYRTSAGSLADAASLTLTSVRELSDAQWSRLEARDQRPETIEKLRAAVDAPSDATIDAMGESLFESTSVDIATKIRGVFSL